MVKTNGRSDMVDDQTRGNQSRALLNRISSLTFSFILMCVLAVWLGIGILLVRQPAVASVIKGMNDQLFLSWLLTSGVSQPLISAWLMILFVLSGLLLLNLVCCCLTRPALKIRAKNGRKPLLLLTLHILVGLVMIGHVANMTIGFKTARIKLRPGQQLVLPDGRTIRLESIHCSFSPDLMNLEHDEIRKKMTRDRVSLKDNYADFTIQKEGEVVDTGRAFLLRPFRRGSFRITLNRFFPADKLSRPAMGEISVGAVITVADNFLHELFFGIYAAMILCFFVYWAVSGTTDKINRTAAFLK